MPDAPDGSHEGIRSIAARTSSRNNRYSFASNETGESSKRSSYIRERWPPTPDDNDDMGKRKSLEVPSRSRNSRRSHKSTSSGTFLLSNPIFDGPKDPGSEMASRHRDGADHSKGKRAVRSIEQRYSVKGPGGEPVVGNKNSTTAATPNGSAMTFGANAQQQANSTTRSAEARSPTGLDVDSIQIVNLALNLSESRRNIQRRNVSTPLPPTISGFGEGFAGGSLRQHLQQQRRSSRNISPKPDRGGRSFSATSRGASQPQKSPLQLAFEDSSSHYQFSASTLARAEKAKSAIELMAQYRRLLQYLPPLRPAALSRVTTASSYTSSPASPTDPHFAQSTSVPHRSFGRQYNPLQYIRNRTVRARERKAIDGEAQGFGVLDDVKVWVDQIADRAQDEDYQSLDCVPLPPLNEHLNREQTSPKSGSGVSKKVARPRVGWMTNPADMLADVYWLEQGNNKKSIENHHWQGVFPPHHRLVHATSQNGGSKLGDNDAPTTLESKFDIADSLDTDPDIDITQYKAAKSVTEDSGSSRIRQKLHELGTSQDHRVLPRIISRSRSDTSESESEMHRPAKERTSTSESRYLSTDVLEKQMLEMLRSEAKDSDATGPYDAKTQKVLQTIEVQKPKLRKDLEIRRGSTPRAGTESPIPDSTRHRRNGSQLRSDDSQTTSGRNSLDVPEFRGRRSVDTSRQTAPNSPQLKAKAAIAFVPPLGMNLASSQSRTTSPTRKPLDKIKSRIPFSKDHSPDRDSKETSVDTDERKMSNTAPDSPATPERIVRRSTSPQKAAVGRRAEENFKASRPVVSQKKEHDMAGIRGLFKSGRNNVSRIGDMIWKKDASPASVMSSHNSTDISDDEDYPEKRRLAKIDSIDSSGDFSPSKERKSFDLPSFISPFEKRGRDKRVRSSELGSPEANHMTARQRHESLRTSRFDMLSPPRIDVHDASPGSSPDLDPVRRGSAISDMSDLDRMTTNIRTESSRLNSILGIPGHMSRLPMTGLSAVEARRPSMAGTRQWSISDGRSPSTHRTPMTRREVARVRALLLTSGVKAQEIYRRAHELRTLQDSETVQYPIYKNRTLYFGIAQMVADREETLISKPIPRSQEHIVAAKVLSNDIQLSSRQWQDAAEHFSSTTIGNLLDKVEELQQKIVSEQGLSEVVKKLADDADRLSGDLVGDRTAETRDISRRMERLLRRRRQRFRSVRKLGWVALEWVLVGVMWWTWALVVIIRIIAGLFKGAGRVGRWLLWL